MQACLGEGGDVQAGLRPEERVMAHDIRHAQVVHDVQGQGLGGVGVAQAEKDAGGEQAAAEGDAVLA